MSRNPHAQETDMTSQPGSSALREPALAVPHDCAGLSVVFWPAIVETAGPFAWFRAAVLRRLPQPGSAWEDDLADAIRQAGGRLHDDSELGHPMQHESRECFFDAVINSGPGRVLLARHGAAWVDSLRQDVLSAAPRGPLVHTPTARHRLVRR